MLDPDNDLDTTVIRNLVEIPRVPRTRVYVGTWAFTGLHPRRQERSVEVRDGWTGRIELLRHYVRHSPTGFAWGYGGEAPADLARCLLIDVVGCGNEQNDIVERLYQDFKSDVVANLPDTWAIPARLITGWLWMNVMNDAVLREAVKWQE